jgi:hypothetical protein
MIHQSNYECTSDPSDEDCEDVDEMIVISAQWQANSHRKATQINESD